MDAYQSLFYGVGQIAYATAMADGKIQKAEHDKFQQFLKEELLRIDSNFDYTDIIFQVLEREQVDFETSYKWGIDSIKLGSHKLTSQLKWEFLDLLCKIAESYPPSTKAEMQIVTRFANDLRRMK